MLMTNETRLGSQSEAQNIRIFKLYFLLFSHKLRAELNRSLQNTMNLCITGNCRNIICLGVLYINKIDF